MQTSTQTFKQWLQDGYFKKYNVIKANDFSIVYENQIGPLKVKQEISYYKDLDKFLQLYKKACLKQPGVKEFTVSATVTSILGSCYSDKRKDGYRMKPAGLFSEAYAKACVRKLKKLFKDTEGVSVELENVATGYISGGSRPVPIVRTDAKPSSIIVK